MTRASTFMKTLTAVILIVMVALAGCVGTSPEGPTVTTPSQAPAATATSGTVGSTATSETGTEPTSTGAVESTQVTEGADAVVACTRLNLNDVTEDALMSTIPGFSSRMVREFMEYRPYASIQQFRREIGKYVDEATVAQYEQYVYVPVDANASDAATLMQLPGVDDAVAGELISGRPYASNEAFLAALAGKVNEQQLSEASCYLAVSQ